MQMRNACRFRCPKCGSTHVMIYGQRIVEFQIEVDGKKADEEITDVQEAVDGVECLECGEFGEADKLNEWRRPAD
jgi:predicted nucleic-acid-binding Zn-ribbon protein